MRGASRKILRLADILFFKNIFCFFPKKRTQARNYML